LATAQAIAAVAMIAHAAKDNAVTAHKVIAQAITAHLVATGLKAQVIKVIVPAAMKGVAKALVIATVNKSAIVRPVMAGPLHAVKRVSKGRARLLVPKAMATRALAQSLLVVASPSAKAALAHAVVPMSVAVVAKIPSRAAVAARL
jgi:hypothetical protein